MQQTENKVARENNPSDTRLKLMSKELEMATKEFLVKVAELERLLPLIDE